MYHSRQRKRKASPVPEQPLSAKRGKRSSPQSQGRKRADTSTVASAPDPTHDTTSIIEEFTDVIVESPATKRDGKVKRRDILEETSIITTPGNTPHTGAHARSEPPVARQKSSVATTAKQSASRKITAKAKPELVTPAEFAQRLQEQETTTIFSPLPPPQAADHDSRKARQSSSKLPIKTVQHPQYLRDLVIFYTGGDLTYASARTRGCMSFVRFSPCDFFCSIRISHRFTDTVGPYFQNSILQWPRTSSQKLMRRTPSARLHSRASRKSP